MAPPRRRRVGFCAEIRLATARMSDRRAWPSPLRRPRRRSNLLEAGVDSTRALPSPHAARRRRSRAATTKPAREIARPWKRCAIAQIRERSARIETLPWRTTSSSQRSNGWTGSTIAGCWSLSATSRRLKPRNATTPCWQKPPWRRDSNKIASGNPGAVLQNRYCRPAETHRP
jgi:hypothetical protein